MLKNKLSATVLSISMLTVATIGKAGECQSPPSTQGSELRALPSDNLAYPVLVTFPNSTASGFYLNTKQATYLVTARHVLFKEVPVANRTKDNPAPYEIQGDSVTLSSPSKDPREVKQNIVQIDLKALYRVGEVKYDDHADVAVVRIFDAVGKDAVIRSGVKPVQNSNAGIVGVTIPGAITKYDDVLVGNDVFVFGYPASIGMQNSPQFDYNRPLLRKGLIAGLNNSAKTIILDCPVYFGNSGGPVLEVDRDGFRTNFRVIGVVSEYIPFNQVAGSQTMGFQLLSNSGYSVVAPIDYVIDLVHQFNDPAQ